MNSLGSVSVPGAEPLKALEFPTWGQSHRGLLLGLQREPNPAEKPTKAFSYLLVFLWACAAGKVRSV